MTIKEITMYECDNCGGEFTEDSDFIKPCGICEQHFCEECQDDHAKSECGF